MKLAAIAGGITLAILAVGNRPPMTHTQTLLCIAGMLGLMLLAFVAGKREGSATATATATATASASSQARAAGGSVRSNNDARVQVVVIPQGADPVAAAAMVGGVAYELDADSAPPALPPPPLTSPAVAQFRRYTRPVPEPVEVPREG